MLPGLTPLNAVDGGGVHAKFLSDLAHRLTTSCQLALDLNRFVELLKFSDTLTKDQHKFA